MKMKKKASATPAKKTAPKKKPVVKSAAPRKAVAKAVAKPVAKVAVKTPAAPAPSPRRPGTYTPPPVQGTGWAPFRYLPR